MNTLKAICLATATLFLLALTLATLELRGLARDLRISVRMSDATLGNLNDTALETAKMAKSLAGATDAETAKLHEVTEEGRKTERAFRAGIDSLRQVFIDLHQQVIPQVTKTVTHLDENQMALMEQLTPTLQALSLASQSAATQLSSPDIPKALGNLADASESAADATKHLSEVTAAGERTAKYYEKKLTTPASFLKTLANFILQAGSQARILFSH